MKNLDKLLLGIQGGKGSFNEEAAIYYLNKLEIHSYELIYLHTSKNVLSELNAGKINRGQFAIHNTLGGVVDESI